MSYIQFQTTNYPTQYNNVSYSPQNYLDYSLYNNFQPNNNLNFGTSSLIGNNLNINTSSYYPHNNDINNYPMKPNTNNLNNLNPSTYIQYPKRSIIQDQGQYNLNQSLMNLNSSTTIFNNGQGQINSNQTPINLNNNINAINYNIPNNQITNQINTSTNALQDYYPNNINNNSIILENQIQKRQNNIFNASNQNNNYNIQLQRQQMQQNMQNLNNLNPKTVIGNRGVNNILYKNPQMISPSYNIINNQQYYNNYNQKKIMQNIDNNFAEDINSNNEIIFSNDPTLIRQPVTLDFMVQARGLENVGATCYMNATLQCFYHVKRLSETIINDNEINNSKLPLTYCFKDLIEELTGCKNRRNFFITKQQYTKDESVKNSFAPNKFKEIISEMNPLFKGIAANDSKDLILFLLETMDAELTKKNNRTDKMEQFVGNIEEMQPQNFVKFHNSIFSEVFYGFQKSVITCKYCRFTTNNYSIINFMIFPLEKTYNGLKQPQQGNMNFNNMNMFGYMNNNNNYMNMFPNLNNSYNPYMNNSFLSLNSSTFLPSSNLRMSLNTNLNEETNRKLTLDDCFKEFMKGEELTGQNQIYCNNCHQQYDAVIRYEIVKAPNVLILIINRGRGNYFKCDLDFPPSFNLNQYKSNNNNGYDFYDLIGVISHLGESSMEGHFIAYCKHFDDNWYIFNDSIVKQYDPNKKFSGIPYILFYKRRDWN